VTAGCSLFLDYRTGARVWKREGGKSEGWKAKREREREGRNIETLLVYSTFCRQVARTFEDFLPPRRDPRPTQPIPAGYIRRSCCENDRSRGSLFNKVRIVIASRRGSHSAAKFCHFRKTRNPLRGICHY